MEQSKPGQAARELLGGDSYVHAFDAKRKADEYQLRMPGARVLYPRSGGWGGFIREVCDGLHTRRFRDVHVIIELERDAHESTKNLVRSLGRCMLERGAAVVRCHGRRIYPDGTPNRQGALPWK